MRKLTASEKIAQLEHRIAHLEKQALLSDMKEKIVQKIEAFKSVRREVAPILKRAGSPEKLAKSYVKMSKTQEYEQAMKELRAQVGPNPIKQVQFLIDAKKNPELVLDNPLVRSASLRKNAGLAFFLVNPELLLLAVLIIGSVITFLLHVSGIKRFASHNKEALLGTLLFGVVMFVIGWFVGKDYDLNISLDKRDR
jgi:hypothetical protein